jgi:hypothetical protein
MKIPAVVATALLLALAAASGAVAQPNSASTVLIGTPTAGSTFSVQFTVFGSVAWTDQDPFGNPQVTMPVYLLSVPSGSSCRVSLVKNNTVVKGSTGRTR